MSTGIILALGLGTIVLTFYVVLNIPYWLLEYKKRKSEKMLKPRKYHDWVYMADDSMNKVLKTVVYCLFGYGFYVFFVAVWEKFI